jgi:hypothetical protein
MRREKNFIDIFIAIDNTLLFPRQMQLPVHEHSIGIRDSGFEIFAIDVVDAEDGAGDAHEIYEVRE